MRRITAVFLLAIGPGLLLAAHPLGAAQAEKSPDFESQIRPLLQHHCSQCHGPETQRGGLRLEARSFFFRGGDSGPVVNPGQSDSSLLIHRITSLDTDLQMPPEGPRLTPVEVQLLRSWIDAGASWPETDYDRQALIDPRKQHWSFQPLPSRIVPPVTDHAPQSSDIDRFLIAQLSPHGLTMNPPADRRTLIRRAYLVMTGLLPTPQQVDSFVGDPTPTAWNSVVEQLLTSPHYGERWAQHWLDVIRYADTHGFEVNTSRDNAWPYRDYVIQAFNSDKPWNSFVREQIAGDLLGEDAATGFLVASAVLLPGQIGADDVSKRLARQDALDEIISGTSSSLLGLTLACARCHDHKFDPVSQADYYSLQAVFAGIGKGEISYDADSQVAADRRHWQHLLTAAENRDPAVLMQPAQQQLADTWEQQQGQPATWTPLRLQSFLSVNAAELSLLEDGSILSAGPCPDRETTVINGTTALQQLTAVRLDVLTHESLPAQGPGRAENGNLHLNEVELLLFRPAATTPQRLTIRRASADFNQTDWTIQQAIDGNPESAWGIHPQVGQPHFAIFELDQPVSLTPDCSLQIVLRQTHGRSHIIGRLQLSVTDANGDLTVAIPADIATIRQLPATARSPEQQLTLTAFAVRQLATERLAALPAPRKLYTAATVAQNERGTIRYDKPREIHILTRGDVERPGELVPPGALMAVPDLNGRFEIAPDQPESARRAALARWLADPRNPLTWRSIANRVWQHHFGRGLCETSGDFGRMGSTPDHPLLLDWLACELRDTRSLKHLHLLICSSQTWARADSHTPSLREVDPQNRLLAARSPRRMDADSWRDCILQASGQLDLTMGGPGISYFSTRPGAQLTPILNYSDYNWDSPGAGRRSIYRVVWRGIADPLLEPLDFPDLGLLAPVRSESVSPLQALTMFNNRFVLHHAEKMAARAVQQGTTPEDHVTAAVGWTWQRQPDEIELHTLSSLARDHGLAAVCRLLLNSSEFLYVD